MIRQRKKKPAFKKSTGEPYQQALERLCTSK